MHCRTHGKKFKTFKEWNPQGYTRLVEDVIGYANYVKQQKMAAPEPMVEPSPAPVVLESGPGQLPLIPPMVQGIRGTEVAKQVKDIIRAYFSRHYRESHIINLMKTFPQKGTYRASFWK